MKPTPQTARPVRLRRLTAMALIAVAELGLIILTYQLMASIECGQTEIELACRGLRSMPARGMSVLTVLALYFWLRPEFYRAFSKTVSAQPGRTLWLAVHGLGLALIFLPLPLFGPAEITQTFAPTLALMSAGGLMATTGAVFWITPLRQWNTWLRRDRYVVPLAVLCGFLLPDFANLIRPIWDLSSLSSLTFFLVYLSLQTLGFQVGVDPDIYVIGVDGFFVQIASQCSGVEGIALITIFMGIYAVLMQGTLRQARFWGLLFPLAVLCSWLFNILRITILIVIGARVSPSHALNGFHSYGGWLMFTALALMVIAVAHRAAWLQPRPEPAQALSELNHDQIAAQIVPFIVMMLTGVVALTFWADPDVTYPLRIALMGGVLLYFRPALVALLQRPSRLSVLAGLAVGVVWLISAPEVSTSDRFPSTAWILFRVVGTIVVVPIIEELFFRSYLLRRLNWNGALGTCVAVAVSSLLFGLLHDRILAGSLAGVVFAAIYLRRSSTTDAIAAHMVANTVVAVMAVLSMNWALL